MVKTDKQQKQETFHLMVLYAYRTGVEYNLWQMDLLDRLAFSADMHERMYSHLLGELYHQNAYNKETGEFTNRAFFEAFDKGRSDGKKHRKFINLGE